MGDDDMEFFDRIKQLRKDKGLTQEEVASILDIPRETYRNYEKGYEIPFKTLIAIADMYNTSIDYILGRTTIKEPYPYK